MPSRTPSLSIKALPLEIINKEQSEKTSQTLSPSSILPMTILFALQIVTKAGAKLTYKINVKQSNNLMQKSALFYDLSTRYTDYASQQSLCLQDNFTATTSLEELAKEADGLPMLFIELPDISTEIIDNLLQWLFSCNNYETKFNDKLTSNLTSSIKSTFDFFGLLNFATLLNLHEPYCSIIDEILVWYYFGLNERERNIKILKNDSFVKEIVPSRFVKRLAESVGEFEEKQILSNYFRSDETNDLKDDNNESEIPVAKSRSKFVLEWMDSNLTPTPRRVKNSLSPLDIVKPPTPLGSAYYCISPPPNTPYSPTFQRILPRSLPRTPKSSTFTKSIFLSIINDKKNTLERDGDDISLTAESSVPPNTPNLPENIISPNFSILSNLLTNNNLMSPNTPISPANIVVPPNTPSSLTIVSPNSPSTPSFFSSLAPPNTPNTPISPNNYSTVNTINGLLSATLIPFSPSSTPTSVPPNTPTSPFIFQSINNNNNNNNNIIIDPSFNIVINSNSNSSNNNSNCSSNNNGNNRIIRKNSREKSVTIDSVLANSLINNLYNING